MKNVLLLLLSALCVSGPSHAQMVGTNIFLQGNFVEIGIQNNGALGVCSGIPFGYHPHTTSAGGGTQLAEVYDHGHDGWTVGTPAYMGDYTYIGAAFEGWELQIGSARTQAFQNCPSASYTTGGGGIGLTGGNVSHSVTSGGVKGLWSGTAMGGQAQISMETSVATSGSAVVMKVKIYNAGSTPLPPAYYFRSCDPDIDQSWGGGFTTTNVVIYQNDAVNRVLVQATGSTGNTLGLGTKDARATALTYSSWPLSSTVDLGTLSAGTYSAVYAVGTPAGGDNGMGLVFNLGVIPAGDSAVFSYAYIFNGAAGLDSVFTPPCSGMPAAGSVSANTSTACATTAVTLTDAGYSVATGLAFQWQSSPDSAAWSNVAGATSSVYSFTGLTATSFYRCVVTCSSSLLSASTASVKITYSPLCPCLHSAGVAIPNTSSACSTTAIVLNDTGYTVSSGVTLQWQSSPDSVSWADWAGATAVPYSFTGIAATTWYRLKATCTATGLALYTAGKKIAFSSTCLCAGTPVAGTAIASTVYCSSCALTLDLTGVLPMSGYTYQWQRSLTGISGWANITGATTVPYTHSPTQSYYYRCNVTCTHSGLTAPSTNVFVNYYPSIVFDTVILTDTVCSGQMFYVRANGTSPSLQVKTYFGDGTSSLSGMTVSGIMSYANVGHIYSTPGTYTVKQVLYLGTVALDSVIFTYEHLACRVLPIRLYLDNNGNCSKESSECYSYTSIAVRIDSNDVPVDTLIAVSGLNYKARGGVGTVYSFRLISPVLTAICPASGIIYDTITSLTGNYPAKQFGIVCGGSSVFDLSIFGTFRAGPHLGRFSMLVSNNLCYPVEPTATINLSPKYKYGHPSATYAMPAHTSYTDHSVTWTRPAMTAGMPTAMINGNGWKATSAEIPLGDTVNTNFIVFPGPGDGDPGNNNDDRNDTVKAAYDPNYIEVVPGCFDYDTTLRYTIHFENLGNDTAHNVHVLDTMSANLDVSSLKVLATSDEMFVYNYQDGPYNIMKFDFPNIKLLDSSWHGLNQGMFVYSVKNRPGMATGETILNRVGIYFDVNEVVMTNTSQAAKGCPITTHIAGARSSNISLFPNPATDELTITTGHNTFTSFTITNAVGQQVLHLPMHSQQEKVSVRHLPAGVYYVTLRGEQGSEVRKFVKW